MPLLATIILSSVLLIALFHAPTDWRGLKPIFSAYSIVLTSFIIYAVLPAILNQAAGDFIWAPLYYSDENLSRVIWICVLSASVFLFVYGITRSLIARASTGADSTAFATSVTGKMSMAGELLLYGIITFGLLIKIYIIMKAGGIDSLVRLSGFGRKFSGQSGLDASAVRLFTLSGLADGAVTWAVIRAVKDRQREIAWLVVFTLTMVLSYSVLGKRLVLLLPLFCVAIGYHNYRRPLTMKLLPLALVGAVVLGFGTILARTFIPSVIGGYAIDYDRVAHSQGSLLKFYFYSGEYMTIEMIAVVMQGGKEIVDLFGGSWNAIAMTNFAPVFYTIPRILWPSKPTQIYDYGYALNAYLGNTPYEEQTVGWASTLIGTSLATGILTLIVAMGLLGIFAAVIDSYLKRSVWSERQVFLYALSLVFVFYWFRQGSIGWAFIISAVQNYGIIAALILFSYIARPNPVQADKPATPARKSINSSRL